jgi:putative acetyltransferase
MKTLTVRVERPGDVPGVRRLLIAAFPDSGGAEVGLVDALRVHPAWLPGLSVVAEDDQVAADAGGLIVGHALLSRVIAGDTPALALGPVAVLPDHQGRGIGTAVVRNALDRAAAAQETLVVVLGDPAYYRRFGFVPALSLGLTGAWDALGDAWQALVLPGAPAPQPGEVIHPSPWHDL